MDLGGKFGMKKLFWMPVVFVLSSCSMFTEFKTFEEPVTGDRARVRVVEKDDLRVVQAIPGKDHAEWTTPGTGVVLGPINALVARGFTDRSLGMPPGSARGNTAEFYVKAGEPITLVAKGTSKITGYQYVCHEETTYREEGKGKDKVKVKEVTTKCGDEPVYESCETTLSFTAEKNMDYEVVYSEQNVRNCSLDLHTL